VSPERFSTSFARRPARARRGLTPGRRVWTSLGVAAATAVAVTGGVSAAGVLAGPDGGDGTLAAGEPRPSATAGPERERQPAPEEPSEEAEPTGESSEEAGADEDRGDAGPADDAPPADPDPEPADPEPEQRPESDPEPEPEPEPEREEESGGEDEQAQPEQAPAQQPVTGATGHIIGLAGKCAEIPNDFPAPGTGVQIDDCDASRTQQWTVASDGTLRVYGYCLSLAGRSTNDGTRVALATCDPTDALQRWRIERDARDIVNVVADKCLDVANAGTANGTPVQIAWCSGNPAQKWSAP
jgi:hypothetical protein